jgi:hypothetical protein
MKGALSLYNWRDKFPYFMGVKKAKKDEMPDFIIAGLPKCGTVWLVEALKEYSQFNYVKNPFYSHKHEIRFFSFNFNQPIKAYLNTFKKQTAGKLNFEKSPDYSVMSTTRIKLIKKLNPTIKIILIFRDPIERAFSNAKMDLIRKKNIILTPENNKLFFNNYDSQLRRYDYEKILKKWGSVFPKEQLLILSLEDIKAQPQNVLKKVFTFFDTEYKPQNFSLDEAKNTTKAGPLPESHRKYIIKQIPDIIKFWNENAEIFRINKISKF